MTDRPWNLHFGDGVDGLLGHGSVDHTITDTPYAAKVEDGNAQIEVRDNPFSFEPMTEELRNRTARAIAQTTRRWALVFCDLEESYLWRIALESAGMAYWRTGLWVRQNTAPQFNGKGPAQAIETIVLAHSRVLPQRWNGGGKPAIWYAPIVRGSGRVHETQKPGGLFRELIEDFTDEGELIADPFGGSCTTGVAAVSLGRRFVGWEKDAQHYNDGLHRLEQPLWEGYSSMQIPLIDEMGAPKGAAAKARMELERTLFDSIEARGSEGISIGELPEVGTETERRNALKRLAKRRVILRTGRTSNTRYLARQFTQKENSDGYEREKSNPGESGSNPTGPEEQFHGSSAGTAPSG